VCGCVCVPERLYVLYAKASCRFQLSLLLIATDHHCFSEMREKLWLVVRCSGSAPAEHAVFGVRVQVQQKWFETSFVLSE
jgi:hypothetical protein